MADFQRGGYVRGKIQYELPIGNECEYIIPLDIAKRLYGSQELPDKINEEELDRD